MPIVSLFSASYCHAEEVILALTDRLGYRPLAPEALLREAAQRYGVPEVKLGRAMFRTRSVFDLWKGEKDRHVARLRATLAELLEDGTALYGFPALLVPRSLSLALRVCLVASADYRARLAAAQEGVSEKAARKLLRRDDEAAREWSLSLHDLGPFDERLHDARLPMDSTTVEAAVLEISALLARPAVRPTARALKGLEDFRLAAQVALALADNGIADQVESSQGAVTVTIDRYVARLDALREEIQTIASRVGGVKTVKTKVGPHYQAPIGMPALDLPRKVLLVDDEREFVHTLSERLTTRNLESVVAYDGEQALAMVAEDAPEVMVLDLKMPGIDGLEVLRRVKLESPATEVIILTGHGSDAEEALAEELGAFAYLNKPVDIDLLAQTMREAYARVEAHRKALDEADRG